MQTASGVTRLLTDVTPARPACARMARHPLLGPAPASCRVQARTVTMRPLLQPLAPEIDDPMALLEACHDKVRRFARLTERLIDHVARKGSDAEAREAAASVLRYFDLAAPLHHDDEDVDLFPALQTLADPNVNASMARLQAEHDDLGALWQAGRPWLEAVRDGLASGPGPVPAALRELTVRYPAHADAEEAEIYPAATRLTDAQRRALSAAMVARRHVA